MDDVEGATSFQASGAAYDSFMGRYSTPLAACFADAAGVQPWQTALDVGCGPGALTAVLVDRLGADAVAACDPSPSFIAECATRHPGVDVRHGRAEALPFTDGTFDRALAQLVLHFVTDAPRAAAELRRVARPDGIVGACVWDFADGMEMLRRFWDAALSADRSAPDEARGMRFGRPGEIAELFGSAGLVSIVESTLEVASTYVDFAELWTERLFADLGSPAGPLTLKAIARCSVGVVPA